MSDASGGAARAALRLHRALQATGHSSRMTVREKELMSDSSIVVAPKMKRFIGRCASYLDARLSAAYGNHLSLGMTTGIQTNHLGMSEDEILHLHWISSGGLSAPAIGQHQGPVAWTLHDMWPFMGVEHYEAHLEAQTTRTRASRTIALLNRIAVAYRERSWGIRRPALIAPTNWIAELASNSHLFRGAQLKVIPNALDTSVFRPTDKSLARARLRLPMDAPVVGFVSATGFRDQRKGGDLLLSALGHLARDGHKFSALIVGGPSAEVLSMPAAPNIRWVGQIANEYLLNEIYNAMDVCVVPSRLDNLPQTATEAQAAGVPVVGFAVGGMPDAVEHGVTGYLAKPLDDVDLAEGILWSLNPARNAILGTGARNRAHSKWRVDIVAEAHAVFYKEIVHA